MAPDDFFDDPVDGPCSTRQLTKEEAVMFHDSGLWRQWTPRQRAGFQLYQKRLCMPFDEFHKAMEEALGRPIWTHEFGLNVVGLKREFEGKQRPPTMQEIIELIPAEKRVVVALPAPGVSDGPR